MFWNEYPVKIWLWFGRTNGHAIHAVTNLTKRKTNSLQSVWIRLQLFSSNFQKDSFLGCCFKAVLKVKNMIQSSFRFKARRVALVPTEIFNGKRLWSISILRFLLDLNPRAYTQIYTHTVVQRGVVGTPP